MSVLFTNNRGIIISKLNSIKAQVKNKEFRLMAIIEETIRFIK